MKNSLELKSPVPGEKPADYYRRPPFYAKYDFGRDYYNLEARDRIADFLERNDQAEMADRFRSCRQNFLLLKCVGGNERQGGSFRCRWKKYPDPFSDDRDEHRGHYISRASCRSRFCEPCARVFGHKFRKKVKPFIRAVGTRHWAYGFKHLTLTFKRESDVEITPEWIRGAFRCAAKFIRRFYHEKNKKGEFKTGALAVMEMSATGFFHIHCLVYGRYHDLKTELSPAWLEITGNSYRVDISDAQGRSKRYPNLTPDQALHEVTKYIKKPVTSPFLEEVFRYITAIKGRRRIHTWGLFYNHPDLKPPSKQKLRCPFCNGAIVLVGEYDPDRAGEINDGTFWPVWAVKDNITTGRLPMRYD